MAKDETATARRSTHSLVPLPRHAADPAGRVNCAEFGPSGPIVTAAIDFVNRTSTGSLFEAIEAQRLSVLNMLGIVHCISVGVASDAANPTPEISAAFELLEREIQRVATTLEKISLQSAMRVICRCRGGPAGL
jgi:hypothetical protein